MECVGVARDAVQCVKACQELLPDVVVLDDEMPGARGLQVLEWLGSDHPDIRVVMYTLDAEVCESARHLGAAGCVLKIANYEVLRPPTRNRNAQARKPAERNKRRQLEPKDRGWPDVLEVGRLKERKLPQ